MTQIQGPGALPLQPLSPPPAPSPSLPEAAAAATPGVDPQARARAQDQLNTLGLSLSADYAENGLALDALVDESLLPLDAVLRAGSDPEQVKALQSSLNALGHEPPLAVDGLVGPLTMAAVRDFQSRVGLSQDGLAGPNTNRALMAVEAMSMAAAADDPAEAAEFKAQAQELISGIQPVEQQATLQAQLDALPVVNPPAEAESPAVAEASGGGATPLGVGDAPADYIPNSPPLSAEEAAAGVAPPEEVAADAMGRADIDARAAVGGDAAVAAEVEVRGEELSTGALVTAQEELLNDFWVGDADARAAGEAAAHLVNEDPSRLDALWSRLQDSSGANNKEAFIEGFLSKLDPAVAAGLARSSPETIAAMQDEYNAVERYFGDASSEALEGMVAASDADPTGGVGESTDAALRALEEANENGSLLEHLSPEWLASTTDPVVLNRAFQLLCQGRTSWSDAQRAGEVAAALLARDPSMAENYIEQFDSYDSFNQDTFNQALVGALDARGLAAIASINPALMLAMQSDGGLSDDQVARVKAAWLSASPEAQARAFEWLGSGWTGAEEATQMGQLVAALANQDPQRFSSLVDHFNNVDTGDYASFVEALWAGAGPELRAIMQSDAAMRDYLPE